MTLRTPRIALAAFCLATASLSAQADQALAASKNCMSCHAVERKVVGPSYKEIAAKYKGDKTAAARMSTKIIQGGGDVWGPLKMPSNPQLSKADADKLAAWVLSH